MIRKKGKFNLAEQDLLELVLRFSDAMESKDVPITQILVFLYIAIRDQGEGVELQDLIRELKLSSAAASRHVAALADWHWRQKPGIGLVERHRKNNDRRRTYLSLTKKGWSKIGQIKGS